MRKIILMLVALFMFSCNEDDNCETIEEPVYGNECTGGERLFNNVLASKNINVYNGTLAFTTLNITQNRFKSCVNGYYELDGYTENIVSFSNNTIFTISFDYVITQTVSNATRNYQGVVANLLPGATYTINTGDNTFYNLNSSLSLIVQSNSVFYN